MEVVGASVNVIGSGLQSEIHDHTGFHAIVCRRTLLSVEFLDGVHREKASRSACYAGFIHDCFPVIHVVVVGAIDEEIIVVGTIPVRCDRVKPSTRRTLHTGMKRQQVLEIAALQREFAYRFVPEHGVQGAVDGIGERTFRRDDYRSPPPRRAGGASPSGSRETLPIEPACSRPS